MGAEATLVDCVMDKFTLDTNALIYYAKDEPAVVRRLEELIQGDLLYISAVTEIELFSRQNLPQNEAIRIETALREVFVIALDSHLARSAASLRREYGMDLPDSAIAATSLLTGSTLLTRNIRDFKRVPGLSIEKI